MANEVTIDLDEVTLADEYEQKENSSRFYTNGEETIIQEQYLAIVFRHYLLANIIDELDEPEDDQPLYKFYYR